MRSRLLLLAALGAGMLVGGPLFQAAVDGTIVPQAHAQAAADEVDDEAALRQEDFQRARIEGNRLVLRGNAAAGSEAAPAGAAAGEAAGGEATAEEAAAGEAAADEAAVANERASAVAGADAAAAEEAQAGAGAAAAGEVAANAGAEAESNAGAEAQANPGAEAEAAAAADQADQAAEVAAEADADARLAEREAAALRAVDRAAEEEEATEPAEVDDLAGGGFGVAPGDAAAGMTDLGDAATVAEELAEEGDAAVAASAADATAAAAGAGAAGARQEAAALAAEEPLPAGEAPELATETPVEGEAAMTAGAPEEPTAGQPQQLTPAQRRAAAARAAAEERARRMDEVVGAVNQLNSNQQALDDRTLDLQAEQDAVRDRGAGLEDARVARVAAYDAAMAQLLDVADFLSTGGGTDADAQLVALSASLGQLAQNAFQTSGEEEANRVLTAQQTVEASRATLAQSDPFGARIYLRATMDELTAARSLAESYAEPLFREE